MKRTTIRTVISFLLTSILLLSSCNNSHKGLNRRVLELCRHIPDPECLEQSKGFLTEDYYAVLDKMINLPEISPVLHQWEFWFVAADGSPIAGDECEVISVEKTDAKHLTASVIVQPSDTDYDKEEHQLYLEKVKGKWLLSDYDETLQASHRYIDIYYNGL